MIMIAVLFEEGVDINTYSPFIDGREGECQ